MQQKIAHKEALFYENLLQKEINEDWASHGKKAFKRNDKNDDNTPPSSGEGNDYTDDVPIEGKTIKCSTTDPESGWFRKGEHKHVFAYAVEAACDKNGRLLGYTVNHGNEHDSRTFKEL